MEVKDLFSRYGIRNTAVRRQIFQTILGFKRRHFSAEDVLVFLRGAKNNVSRASVFRTISLFSRKGLLKIADLEKKYTLYELGFNSRHHDHLYCVVCGRIIEFEDNRIESWQREVCSRNKFYPLSHSLKIEGICDSCRKKQT